MIIDDERGQGAAEYILLFGGMIVIAVVTLLIYKNYVESTNPFYSNSDMDKVRSSVPRNGYS